MKWFYRREMCYKVASKMAPTGLRRFETRNGCAGLAYGDLKPAILCPKRDLQNDTELLHFRNILLQS